MFNEFPYTNYEKINLDWLLDLGNKLKADAESGKFDGERGPGIFGITTIWPEGTGGYAIKFGDVKVGDFIIGHGPETGVINPPLYIMKVTSITGNYLEGTSFLRITGPQGVPGPQGEQGEPGEVTQVEFDALSDDVSVLSSDIGDLSDLDTEDKSSLVNAINEARGTGGSGLTEAQKQAILQLARKVAYIDGSGLIYYNALYAAFYGSVPVVELDSITAVFNQGSTVIYDTDTLDSLKSMLTVTAHYSDNTTATVPSTDYTLSGTLTEGTSTVTVSYSVETTTFNVVVTHYSAITRTYFADANPHTGYLKKTNGSDQALNGGSYVELDYVDGMYIHTRMNRSWSAYLNIVMYNGLTYSSTPMTQTGAEAYPTYENTLTGYTGITKVYVNCLNSEIADCYYEV